MTATIPFSDMLLQFAASNLAVALPLALIAFWVQSRGRLPFLAHLLWLVVLVKLVTPPLASMPIVPVPEREPVAIEIAIPAVPETSGTSAPMIEPDLPLALPGWKEIAAALWILGSALVLVWSLHRIYRFDRLLRATSEPAGQALDRDASALAASLGLKKTPAIRTTTATISPMAWWVGGRVYVYVPRAMVLGLERAELRSILAHELGHVRRGDHYVRWLECAVCVALWWNPLAWWARRNLRVCEEICCDAFVLSKIDASRKTYAGALVSAMELLAAPAIRPSSLASNVNGGGFIERRIKMILSKQSFVDMPRWLRGALLVGAAVMAPLGFTPAQETDDLERVQQWLEAGVNSAYLTEEQAAIMLGALRGRNYLVDSKRNVVLLQRPFVPEDEPARSKVLRAAFEFAHAALAQMVEAGQITEDEAQTRNEDFVAALSGHGLAYFEEQFELGMISKEDLPIRKRTFLELQEAWLASPAATALRPTFGSVTLRTGSVEVSRDAEGRVVGVLRGDPADAEGGVATFTVDPGETGLNEARIMVDEAHLSVAQPVALDPAGQ